jgi:hypothetical protein
VSAADLELAAYGQDDPGDVPSDAVATVLSQVEVARYWNRQEAGMTRLPMDVELAETRAAQRLSVVLEVLGEVSDPRAPVEVLQVGTDVWTAKALTRLGFQVETTTADPVLVSSTWLFDLVLAPEALLGLDEAQRLAATVNLASLVRLGGRLVVGAADEAEYGAVLEPRGFRLDRAQPLPVPSDTSPSDTSQTPSSALLVWTRES